MKRLPNDCVSMARSSPFTAGNVRGIVMEMCKVPPGRNSEMQTW